MAPEENCHPTFEHLEGYLQELGRKNADRMAIAVEGRSLQSRPVYSVILTDPGVPAAEKQHVLLSCVHSGERSAVATLFAGLDWLLSDDPLAREVLRRQVVICMPIVHPDGYVEGRLGPGQAARHSILYNGWAMTGVADPGGAPEAVALQRVLDRWQPDLYADVHGIGLGFDRHLMVESSACSPTSITNRPYHQHIARLMDEAALEGGFPSDFHEDDREVLYWGPTVDSLRGKLWWGRAQWSAGLYAYARYHTLPVVMEITWQRSGLLRLQRLLRIGNEGWVGEPCQGYPTRVVGAFGPSGQHQMIAAYGDEAGRQRRSRVELWGRHHQLATSSIDPPMTGKAVSVFMLSAGARREWLEGHEPLDAFIANLGRHPGMNVAYLREFLAGWPGGQNRPDPAFVVWRALDDETPPPADEPVCHGVALRIRIPYAKAVIRDLRLNGHPLAESSEDGHALWRARGFTFIQANVLPTRTRSEGFWIMTCEYDPGEFRPHWESWAGQKA